jgi:hypothetical protein
MSRIGIGDQNGEDNILKSVAAGSEKIDEMKSNEDRDINLKNFGAEMATIIAAQSLVSFKQMKNTDNQDYTCSMSEQTDCESVMSEHLDNEGIQPIGARILSIQNQIVLRRRIFYIEFRTKLLNTIAELGIPMNYALQLINCLDRYIPDCCTCCEMDMRKWVEEIRKTPFKNT